MARGLDDHSERFTFASGSQDQVVTGERPAWDEAEEAITEATDALSRVSVDLASAGWAASG